MSIRAFFAVAALASLALLPGCETMSSFVREDGTLDCAALYARRCSQCHALYDPSDYTDKEWVSKVNRYGPRAGIAPDYRPALITWLQGSN
ncbi:MAG: hypothetical protein HRU14_01300 [Planctomycetes bacterium]|nr:hypothetical protein [Planctomycetota bacterium]